jgi:uncharacterized membrane protein YgcG
MDPMLVVGAVFAMLALLVLVFASRRQRRGGDADGSAVGGSAGSHCDSGSDGGGCDGGGGGD